MTTPREQRNNFLQNFPIPTQPRHDRPPLLQARASPNRYLDVQVFSQDSIADGAKGKTIAVQHTCASPVPPQDFSQTSAQSTTRTSPQTTVLLRTFFSDVPTFEKIIQSAPETFVVPRRRRWPRYAEIS